jgi:hypothetical protein
MCWRSGVLIFSLTAVMIFNVGCNARHESPLVNNSNTSSTSEDIATRTRIELAERGLSDVRVNATGSRVSLTGYVDDANQRAEAERIAKETPGVIEVQNEIIICKRPPVNVNKPGGPRRC